MPNILSLIGNRLETATNKATKGSFSLLTSRLNPFGAPFEAFYATPLYRLYDRVSAQWNHR